MLLPYLEKGRLEAGCDEAGRGCLAGPVYAAAVVLPLNIDEILERDRKLIAQGKLKIEESLVALNDSKQLTEKQRYALRPVIEREALAWAVGICDNHEIDRMNILKASIEAMHRAVREVTEGFNGFQGSMVSEGFNGFQGSMVSEGFNGFQVSKVSKISEGFKFQVSGGKGLKPETLKPENLKPETLKPETLKPETPLISMLLIDGNRFSPYPGIPHQTIVKGDGKMMSIAAASILAKTYRDDKMVELDKEYPQYGWAVNKGYPTKAHRAGIAQYGPTPYHRMSFTLLPPTQLEIEF